MTFNSNPRTKVAPETQKVDGAIGGVEERHPSYTMIGASRCHGGKVLFGSDLIHQNYISVRIKGARVTRGLSNDWYHAEGREIIEVCLSEAQWASFISTMNVGDGVPCTAAFRHDIGYIPQIPEPTDRRKQFANELQQTVAEGLAALDELAEALKDTKLSIKQREELIGKVSKAHRSINGSAKFVSEQFSEHMEKVTAHAKSEVYGFIEAHIRRSGLEALTGPGNPVLSFGDDKNVVDAE